MTSLARSRSSAEDNQGSPLHALFAHAPAKSYPKHALLFSEGESNVDSIYFIDSGRVKVFLCSADGKEVDLDVLEPGDFFGEMELDAGPRSASVLTLAPSRFLVVHQAEFKRCLAENPEFAFELMLKLIARTRRLLKSVKSLALLDVSDRVARLLLDMATEEDGKLIITEKLSKRDIANRVGATREMASRVFKHLVSSGYIQLEQKRITIAKKLPQHW